MKKILFICMMTLLATNGKAQKERFDVWPSAVPGAVAEKAPAVTNRTAEDNVLRVTRVTNPTLAVYPPTGKANGNAVIVCPGGGYSILAYDKEGTEIAAWLAALGYTAYVLDYRVPNQPDGALQDAQRALRIVRSRHPKAQVGIMGFSAGASLSARAATRYGEKLYAPIDATDSLTARPDFALLIYPAYLDKGENHSLTPELTLSKQMPPMFIFATADDGYSNSALVMAQALRYNKTPVELHLLPKGGHGYGMRTTVGKIWPGLAAEWLKALK